jgi:hypothetical protein
MPLVTTTRIFSSHTSTSRLLAKAAGLGRFVLNICICGVQEDKEGKDYLVRADFVYVGDVLMKEMIDSFVAQSAMVTNCWFGQHKELD